MKRYCLLIILFFASLKYAVSQHAVNVYNRLNTLLVNTVMEDLFTPPVASRIYAYPNIGFYECIRIEDKALPTFCGKLNGLATLPKPNTNVNNTYAACIAFTYIAQALVASEYKFDNWRTDFLDSLKQHQLLINVDETVAYGKQIADSIIAWSKKDNYSKSRGLMRNVLGKKPGDWQPTPLDYAQGLEPHWNTIRPFTLQKANQFSPKQKLTFSADKKSTFYKSLLQTYSICKKLDSTQKATALYWDDNPNVSKVIGHLNYFVHKISPGGHWLMITQQACTKAKLPIAKTAHVYALTSIAVFDGFISCWDEKYRSNLVRPITIINRWFDGKWEPFIQTPPFPEFTSGHSVISHAAATVLTGLLGNDFLFIDETEIPFGNSARTYNSFLEAAAESSISRVYGGIHYTETAKISAQQGISIGKFVLTKFKTQ
jgi:hypothetical protein